MKLILDDRDQSLISGIFHAAGRCNTVEEYIQNYMVSMNSLLGSDTYGCFLFMSSLTERIIGIDNNPSDYFDAYFNELNDIDLLYQNIFEPTPTGSFPNYQQFVQTNQGAKVFYEESKRIKKHEDYYYRPLRFRDQIVGFYGYVLPEKGKTSFIERDFQLMDLMEPSFNNGIMQAVLSEKGRFLDNQTVDRVEYSLLYLYPNCSLEIPSYTNEKLICEILRIDKIDSESIFSHPLIKNLLSTQNCVKENIVVNSICIERDGLSYTVRAKFNTHDLRHGYRFLTMICFEKDKELFSFKKFALQHKLTKRESEIVEAVVKGQSNKEVSKSLFISEATVKKHMVNIFEKTGCRNRTQLVMSLVSI